ncbi:GNAT family N-acetyltransferase [Hazenella coriacea]|uniref:RimJ/RimL family protein N-acetyltransferase n=1 Tax=Hazenella coriacea TaxID=1179467 RepID=A0A4R3KZR2_9BACL|nr:GNAT family N-acetyltransferase [Hazenella coriacea]TCS92202.1 RimJ/RimL family protein N-acetyltransferase [Hazenella coriacea]
MIETKRLQMVPFTLEYVRAAIMGKEQLESILNYQVSEQWPNPDFAEILPWMADQLEQNPLQSKWSGLIVHRSEQILIGEIGCKGCPSPDGVVEIGYGIVPDYQNDGYATEMVQGFVQWLLQLPEIRKVTAECLKDNRPSVRVLEKVGFTQTRTDQSFIYWEIS